MRLIRLHIHCIRNLPEVILHPHSHFNLFLGPNGSGKTSLLEAIYFLALGRSFRSRQAQHIISYHQPALACFGELQDEYQNGMTMGIEKSRQGEMRCKVRGEHCDKLSQFASTLPLQLITPESFKLLLEGPEERRRFLDWGVFHVEPSFAALCQRYQRLIKQRNAALKQRLQGAALLAWDQELAEIGEKITQSRQHYWQQLQPTLNAMLTTLLPELPLTFTYEQGWEGEELGPALVAALPQDQRWGYTSVGPHRADLMVQQGRYPASQILSRGQQKLLICALYLAQARHLASFKAKKCLFLLDDLASELDQNNRQRILALLAEQGHQVFLTGIDESGWPEIGKQFPGKSFFMQEYREFFQI